MSENIRVSVSTPITTAISSASTSSVTSAIGTPVSNPVAQSQPNQESYGVDLLTLFESFTRDSYLAAFGVQAPAWDPQRLTKTWFDSSVLAFSSELTASGRSTVDLNRLVAYKTLGLDGNGGLTFQDMTLTVAEASTVNIPGSLVYPPYVIAASQASRGPGAVISSNLLSLETDARALMAEVGGRNLVDQGATAVFPVVYAAAEPRRMWAFDDQAGHQVNVGALLQGMNALGMGSPGHWDVSSGDPLWVPDAPAPTGVNDTRPPRGLPVRALLANEVLRSVLVGLGALETQVIRTDLEQLSALQSGAFLESDRQMLADILRAVTK